MNKVGNARNLFPSCTNPPTVFFNPRSQEKNSGGGKNLYTGPDPTRRLGREPEKNAAPQSGGKCPFRITIPHATPRANILSKLFIPTCFFGGG